MDERPTAKLTGKSLKTIQHWAREGVRIYDEASLLEHSEIATRAVVAVAGIVSRADWMTQPTASRNLTSFFPVNIAPDAFVDLPAPRSATPSGKRLCCHPRPSDSLSGTTIRSQSCRSQRKHRTCGIRSCGNRRSSPQPSNCTGGIREMIAQLIASAVFAWLVLW